MHVGVKRMVARETLVRWDAEGEAEEEMQQATGIELRKFRTSGSTTAWAG